MKNLKILRSPDDVRTYVATLWQTPEFQRLHVERGSYIERIVD